MQKNKLGLGSVVSTGVGLIVATTCLMSLGQGAGSVGCVFIIAMVLACILNMMTASSLAELNALMPNLSGGLAQYTLACLGPFPTIVSMIGGYLICNSLAASVEAALFGNVMMELTGLNIPVAVFSAGITVILIIANLRGIDMFAKIQNVVAFLLIGSLMVLGLIGALGLGTGVKVSQPYSLTTKPSEVIGMTAVAFWLFIGVEFIIPIAKDVKNAKKNIPRGMFISLGLVCLMQIIMVLGFHNYTAWNELVNSPAPHILYGMNMLGVFGKVWMAGVSILAAISTLNSVISSLAKICEGMAKLNMMPAIFMKTNQKKAPVAGVMLIGGAILFVEISGLSSAKDISFILLVGSVFWMISYIIAHINVLVLRKRLPKAPRSFKVIFGPVIPIIGIIGTAYMVLNISADPVERNRIWMLTACTFVVLGVYAYSWIKWKMKIPVFKSIKMEEVMAMEHELYYPVHNQKEEVNYNI